MNTKEKTENDYIAEFIKERHPEMLRTINNEYIAELVKEKHPDMLKSLEYSTWKLKQSCYELGQTFKDAAQEIKEAWDSAWNGVDELETNGYTVDDSENDTEDKS